MSQGKQSYKLNNLFNIIEILSLATISFVSTVVGIFDFLGLLDNTFLKDRIPSLILVLCGILSGYFVIERRGILNKIRSSLNALKNSEEKLEIKSILEKNNSFFEGLKGNRFAELKLIYGLRKFSTIVNENQIICSKDQVFTMWNDVIAESNTFYAHNYASPAEVWGTKGWAFNIAQSVQSAKIAQGCIIKRLFILDSMDEYNQLKGLMELQKMAGIEVRWVLRKELNNQKLFKDFISEIGSQDFILADKDLVFIIFLNDNRMIDHSILCRSVELHKKAMVVFNEDFMSGNKI